MKLYQVAVSSIKGLPRQHQIALASTSLLVMAALMWQPSKSTYRAPIISGERVAIDLAHDNIEVLSEQNSEPLGVILDPQDPEFQAPKDDLDKELEAVKDEEHKHKVASGDTLGSIFSQYGLPVSDMYALIDANKSIQHLKVGQQMEWSLDSDGRVKDFSIVRDRKTTDTFTLTKKGYKYKAVEIAGVIKPVILHGKVTGSFYNSARNAGLSPTQIKTVVKALQWKFNLGSDASRGDRFAISLDREFIDGKPVNMGDVNAFFYKHGNQTYFIQRFDDDQFFDQSGRSLNRSFRRFPTAKRYRISSPFNPHRRHPITGRISPHNGTDFAVPVGTPVLASGDGVVVKSRYHPLAGNYIVIKHGREFTTRYLHLSKRLVKVGDRIKMGQRIALSGNTGRSTGPHLHYELIKNGHPVNAMRVPLPQSDPLYGSKASKFRKEAKVEYKKLAAAAG
ncbi:TPA: murein DD-endopeptidase MepM [Photobacterium damselae]